MRAMNLGWGLGRSDEAAAIRDDVSFFQAAQAALNKQSSPSGKTPEQIDAAIRQLVQENRVASQEQLRELLVLGRIHHVDAAPEHRGAGALGIQRGPVRGRIDSDDIEAHRGGQPEALEHR